MRKSSLISTPFLSYFVLLLIVFATLSNKQTSYRLKYNLAKADFNYKLPKELLEISALSYDAQNNYLVAVNDEQPIIYFLGATDGAIKQKFDFGKKGDYEGIELIGDMIYVVKSNGNIFPFNKNSFTTDKEYKTPLTQNNDVEGLGYDKKRNELILACKGNAHLKEQEKIKQAKAFYTFSLDKKELNPSPKFVISHESLRGFFEKLPNADRSEKASEKLVPRLKSFSPSAIAKHPKEGHLYILSSVGKLLVVVNKSGGIKAIEFLDAELFSQPEGICFAPDGSLYISNEGRSSKARILKFNYR